MKPVIVSTTIDRPREEVFAFLDALANHKAFTDHFMVDWTLSGPPTGAGAKARMRVKAPGAEDWIDLEVIESAAPERTVERSLGARGRRSTLGTYTLTPLPGGGTRVEFRIDYERVPAVERLTAPLGRAWLRKQNARALERLAERLSAGREAATA